MDKLDERVEGMARGLIEVLASAVASDPKRLSDYNKGEGLDVQMMGVYDTFIESGQEPVRGSDSLLRKLGIGRDRQSESSISEEYWDKDVESLRYSPVRKTRNGDC